MTQKHVVPAKQHWILAAVLMSAAAIYTSLLIADIVRSSQDVEAARQIGVTIDLNYQIPRMKTRIALALIVGVLTLWPRRRTWFVVSILALSWVVVEYVMWNIDSIRGRAEAGLDSTSPPIAYLHGATRWDIVNLVLVLGILSWQIVLLAMSQRSRANPSPEP